MSYARIQTHDGFVTVKDETHEHYAGEFGEHEKTSGWHGAEGNAAVMAALHADADQRVQELLHAPVGKGGKTRYNYQTQQEGKDFSRGFHHAVNGGEEPKQLPASHGIAQKYQDALHEGWSQGKLWMRPTEESK